MGPKPLLVLVVAAVACAAVLMFLVSSQGPDQPGEIEPGAGLAPVVTGKHPAAASEETGTTSGAIATAQFTEEPIVLKLSTDRELRVKVVDARGAPQKDVPVVLRRPDPRRSGYQTGTRAKTGPDGVARLAHVQLTLDRGKGWEVTFGFPIIDPPTIPLLEATLAAGELQLAMPETGRLVIRCVDVEGHPVGKKATLRLTAHDGDPEEFNDLWPRAPWSSPSRDEKDEAMLSLVGLGIQFRAELKTRDRSSGIRPAVEMGAGPTEPGQTATMIVIFGRDRFPVVTGRVVRQDGEPLPACHLAAIDHIKPDDGINRTWQKVAVDDEGRFRLVIRYAFPQNGSYTCELQQLTPDDDWKESPPKITLDFSRFAAPEDHEIGDVILDYGPLVVAGRVVDQEGHELQDVTVGIMGRQSYDTLPGYVFTEPPGGGFRVYLQHGKELPKKELRLYASHRMAVGSGLQEFTFGTTGVTVVVRLGGTLAGSVKLEDGARMPSITVAVQSKGSFWMRPLRPDGTFEQSPLRPGPVTLVLVLRGGNPRRPADVLVRIENIQISAGEVNRDPRLQGISLPAGLDGIILTMKDPSGGPLEGAMVYDSGSDTGWELGRSGPKGTVLIPLKRGERDLTLVAKGYRSLTLKGVSNDMEVMVKDALRVQVQVVGMLPQHSLDVTLRIKLLPVGPTAKKPSRIPGLRPRFRPVITDGKVSFEISEPGMYRVQWYCRCPDSGSGWVLVQEEVPATLLVEDTRKMQSIIAPVPVTAIRATIAAKDG